MINVREKSRFHHQNKGCQLITLSLTFCMFLVQHAGSFKSYFKKKLHSSVMELKHLSILYNFLLLRTMGF